MWSLSDTTPPKLRKSEGGCYNKSMQVTNYFRETWSELKLVRWPTRDQTLKLTGIVIVISLLVGAYIGSLDLTFTKTLSLIIK